MVWLDNTRVLAIFAVIILHTTSGILSQSAMGSGDWWIGNIYDSLVRWCVPVFVMISGALLLDPQKKETLQVFYSKRLSRILVPLLFWSAFFMLWTVLKGMIKGDVPSSLDLLAQLLSGRPYFHMWFLYMLLGLYVFTPFLRTIVANSTRQEIMLLVVITFFMAILNYMAAKLFDNYSKIFLNWFLYYLPFFFLGYLIRTQEHPISRPLLWTVFFSSTLFTALGYFITSRWYGLELGAYFYGYLSVTVIPMSISIMYLCKTLDKPLLSAGFVRSMAVLTLGIYLIHPIILEILEYMGFGPLAINPAISIPFIALFAFCMSFIGAWVISNIPYLKRII